jgi:hypothetical protein
MSGLAEEIGHRDESLSSLGNNGNLPFHAPTRYDMRAYGFHKIWKFLKLNPLVINKLNWCATSIECEVLPIAYCFR